MSLVTFQRVAAIQKTPHGIRIDKWHTRIRFCCVTFDWDDEKNRLLKRSRGIGFEDIIVAIEEGNVVDVLQHPNAARYPHQQIYLIAYRNYVYAVPFVRNSETEEVFLKTIFPSRRYTKLYLRPGGDFDG
jgi:uncharacterized DUF497 family protein